MVEQLEDKIEQSRNGAKRALVAAFVSAIGLTFDYGIADDIMMYSGAFVFGLNIRHTINYIRYTLKGE